MSQTTENSAIKITPAIEEQLKTASADEIPVIMRQAMLDQNLVRPDWDPSYLIPVEPSAAPRGFARTVTIDGRKHVVERATEIQLEKAVGDLYRAQLTPPCHSGCLDLKLSVA